MISILKKYKTQIKYLIFGVLTTAVDFVISFSLFKVTNVHIADTVGWLAAVIFAYVANKIFVFESKRSGIKALAMEFGAFVGSRVSSFLIQEGIVLIAVDILSFNKKLTRIAAAVIVVITNYFLGKLIFSKKEKADKV